MSKTQKRRKATSGRFQPYQSLVPPQIRSNAPSLPIRLRQTFRYNETALIAPTGTNDIQYNMNSIFEPTPGGGHQPLNRDQFATLYNRYLVLSAKVHVEYQATTTLVAGSPIQPQHVAICGTNGSTAITEVSTCNEQSHGSITKISSVGAPAVVFNRTFHLKDIYGVDLETMFADDNYQAVLGATPVRVARLHIVSSHNGSAAFAGYYSVSISYDTVLFSPGQTTQS